MRDGLHHGRSVMKIAVSARPKEQTAELLVTLRDYAKRVFVQGDQLTFYEARDKSSRMRQFLQMGADCKCTEKEVIGIVYGALLK